MLRHGTKGIKKAFYPKNMGQKTYSAIPPKLVQKHPLAPRTSIRALLITGKVPVLATRFLSLSPQKSIRRNLPYPIAPYGTLLNFNYRLLLFFNGFYVTYYNHRGWVCQYDFEIFRKFVRRSESRFLCHARQMPS